MKKYFVLIIFLFSFLFGYSQCKVINQKTKEPVAFAQIKVQNQTSGKLANIKGEFELSTDWNKTDTLVISCIGFEKKQGQVAAFKPNATIELTPKTEELSEVQITSKKVKYLNKTIGITRRSHSKIAQISTADNGAERATWIPNAYSIPGYLKTIHIFITDKGYPDAPFRIHVYACSNLETRPGNELTKSNIIASASEGDKWLAIDMSAHHIRIPENGCFIGIEWFDSPKSVHFSDTLLLDGKSYNHGTWKDTTYAQVRSGNGMAMGTINEKYILAKNKIWFRNFYSQTTDEWFHHAFDESRFNVPDTLDNGYVMVHKPNRFYYAVPCINIDVAFPKNKIKPVYEKPKSRKLNKLEKVKEDPIKYPQSDVKELFVSFQKAFENDEVIYALKYLCSFRDNQMDEILGYLNENVEEVGEILPEENRKWAIAYLENLNSQIDSAKITTIDPHTFEIQFEEEAMTLSVEDGIWRVNPYSYSPAYEQNRPLIHLR